MSTTIMSITKHCENARTFTRFASRARSVSRLTGNAKVSYRVLRPAVQSFRSDIPSGFHEQVYRYACADNCEVCQAADLSYKRARVAARCAVFVNGSRDVGGWPYLMTLTFPSYAPRPEHIEDFNCSKKRSVFRSEYIRHESRRRYESLCDAAVKWFDEDAAVVDKGILEQMSGNRHYLAQAVPMKSWMDAMFEAKRLEQEAASSRARLTELHNEKTAYVLNHIAPLCSEKEARFLARDMLFQEFKDVHDEEMVAERARHAFLKLGHVRQAHQDVQDEFRQEIIRELDGSDDVPGTFDNLWLTECFERGWLQAVYTVRKGRHKGRRFYMPDAAATSGRNYTDFVVDFRAWQELPADVQDFRPTPAMGQAMFKKFRDRLDVNYELRFSYYGVEENGINSDNFHLHLLVHYPPGRGSTKKLQREWSRVWHAVSGNVIWKPRERDMLGEGRWLEPVRKPEAAAHYVAKYLGKVGGQVRTSNGMFLARCVSEQNIIDRQLYAPDTNYRSETPEFEALDKGRFRYKKRISPEKFEEAGCSEWCGFDFEEAHYRGPAARGPRVKLVFTARSSSKSRSVGSAAGLRVQLADGSELQDGEPIPACLYKLPRAMLRDVPQGVASRVTLSRLKLSGLLQGLVSDGGEDYRHMFSVYRSLQVQFDESFRSVRFAQYPPVSRSP